MDTWYQIIHRKFSDFVQQYCYVSILHTAIDNATVTQPIVGRADLSRLWSYHFPFGLHTVIIDPNVIGAIGWLLL
jgi:hypothetical protein